MPVDFCLLDSRLAASALQHSPYHADAMLRPSTYAEPSGIYLHLYGRSNRGESVVVETELRDGLTVSLLDEHDSAPGLYTLTVATNMRGEPPSRSTGGSGVVSNATPTVRKAESTCETSSQ